MKKKSDLAKGFTVPKLVKRTEVTESDAVHFEQASPKPSKLRRKKRAERLAVYVPSDVVTALRVYCAANRCSLSQALTEAAEKWLKEKGPPAPLDN